MKKLYLLAGLLLLASPLLAQAQRTLIHCGNLFDGIGNTVQPQMTIVVEGNKITGVQKGYTAPIVGDRLVDMKTRTVLPGLIDMHVHLESQTRRGRGHRRVHDERAGCRFLSGPIRQNDPVGGFHDRS